MCQPTSESGHRIIALIIALFRLLLAIPSNNRVRYFATFVVTSGTYTMNGSIIAWCEYQVNSLSGLTLTCTSRS